MILITSIRKNTIREMWASAVPRTRTVYTIILAASLWYAVSLFSRNRSVTVRESSITLENTARLIQTAYNVYIASNISVWRYMYVIHQCVVSRTNIFTQWFTHLTWCGHRWLGQLFKSSQVLTEISNNKIQTCFLCEISPHSQWLSRLRI